MVLENEIYEDSYLHYKKKSRGEKNNDLHGAKPMNDSNYTNFNNNNNMKRSETKTSTWVFKTPPKEVT